MLTTAALVHFLTGQTTQLGREKFQFLVQKKTYDDCRLMR